MVPHQLVLHEVLVRGPLNGVSHLVFLARRNLLHCPNAREIAAAWDWDDKASTASEHPFPYPISETHGAGNSISSTVDERGCHGAIWQVEWRGLE